MRRRFLNLKLCLCLALALNLPYLASALVVGPYTPDASTACLFHLDEPPGSYIATNAPGSLSAGTNLVAFSTITTNTFPGVGVSAPTNFNILGATSASGFNFGNFGRAANLTNVLGKATNGLGWDWNQNGGFTLDNTGAVANDVAPNHNSIVGANNSITMEALINIATTNGNQEIICTDDGNGTAASRGFQFRLNGPTIEFNDIGSTPAGFTAPIPNSGSHAFVPGQWFHVALVHTESPSISTVIYWTRLDDAYSAANPIFTNTVETLDASDALLMVVGNEGRGNSSTSAGSSEGLQGLIDEVRISKVARAANQMMFAPANITINQQPYVQEGVDFGNTGGMSVSASSALPIRYQWRLAGAPISGATNATYSFSNATVANAGNYDCVLSNSSPSVVTSAVCTVTIGAANFLAHRYGFTNDVTDSFGTANGTLNGSANVAGGSLVLDGTTGNYLSLPGGLVTNQASITIEAWASFGNTAVNSFFFGFGNTLGTVGTNYIFMTPRGGTARIAIAPGNAGSEQQAIAGSGLQNVAPVHIVAIYSPVNATLAIYTNSVLAAINTNVTAQLSSVVNAVSYLGHSLFSADPELTANIDEFRIYNGALSAASIQQSYLQGPDNALSTGPVAILASPTNASVAVSQPVTFSGTASGLLPISYQWFKNGVLIPGATNRTYTYNAPYSDNGASFVLVATNTVSSTTYTATSSSATLTVLLPETLAWLGQNGSGWNLTDNNWTNATSLVPYVQFDGALLDDRGLVQPNLDLQFAAAPINLTVSNNAGDYQISSLSANGSLNVLGTLLKTGTGKLTLDVTNNSTTPVVVQSGTLQIGNGDANGSLGTGVVTNHGTLQFNRSDSIAVANDIHGTGSVIVNSGTVTASPANSDYTGGTTVAGGILYATTASALGATTSGTTVAIGAQLYITGNVNYGEESLTFGGVGDGNGALRKGGAGTTTYGGAVTMTTDSTIVVDTGATLNLTNTAGITGIDFNLTTVNAGALNISGPLLLGNGSLTKNGNGTLTLNSSNSYSGVTSVNGGVLAVNNNYGFGASTAVNVASTTGGALGGTRITLGTNVSIPASVALSLPTAGTTVRSTLFAAGASSWNGPITINGDGQTSPSDQLAFAGSGGLLTVNGSITGVNFLGTLQLRGDGSANGGVGGVANGTISIGTATLQINDNVTWTINSTGNDWGLSQIARGTLKIGANNAIPATSTVNFGAAGGATLDLNGFNQRIAALVLAANTGIVTNSSPTSDSTLTYSNTTAAYFGGNLKEGVRKLNLAITGGTLIVSNTAALTLTNSAISIASGTVLDLEFTGTNQVNALVLNGTSQANGVYGSSTPGGYLAGTGYIRVGPVGPAGPAVLTNSVAGGTLTLSWPAGEGWRLLMQTNGLNIGLSNNWVDVTPGAAASTNITIDAAQPAAFYRLVYP